MVVGAVCWIQCLPVTDSTYHSYIKPIPVNEFSIQNIYDSSDSVIVQGGLSVELCE